MTKECTVCSVTLTKENTYKGKARCKECVKESYRTGRRARRQKFKMLSMKRLGGSCCNCGIKATMNNQPIFDFHHIDASTKLYNVADLIANTSKLEEVYNEVDKCVLFCANCHRMHHATEPGQSYGD